jgi:beta-galactosidase
VTPEETTLRPDRLSLAYLPIEIVDAAGRIVPDAALPISLKVEGPAELIALGSANPIYTGLLNVPRSETFQGRALAILRSTGVSGAVRVRLQIGTLPEATVGLKPPAP